MGSQEAAHSTSQQEQTGAAHKGALAAEALAQEYGTPDLGNKADPLDELIYIALTRQTHEKNAQRTWRALTTAYPSWEMLLEAPEEEVAAEAERGADRLTLRDIVGKLQQAIPIVPPVIVAATITLSTATVAAVLLVLPGLWLLTRWSLVASVIKTERLGPVAALKRSNQLVRGYFWAVFVTATLAFILEVVIIDVGALGGVPVFDSETWGEWIGAAIAGSLISPLAALTTSIAYMRLTPRKRTLA